jgi:hypothetical protein
MIHCAHPDMDSLLKLFADNLLPVFLTAGAGYAVAALARPDPRALTTIAFSVFAPCLVFQVIVDNRVPPLGLLHMMAYAAVALAAPALLALLLVRLRRWPRTMASAMVMVVLMPNSGNFGLSANLLAFGDASLAWASLFFLTSSLISFSVGVLVASSGRRSVGEALRGLARVPALWGAALAFSFLALGVHLPAPAARSVRLLSDACIPTFLVILGMQLYTAKARAPLRPLALAVGLRLVGGALAGWVLAPAFGLTDAARQAGTLQAAMPTAVISTILATEYDVEPGFVTAVVFWTTLMSPLTLTPLIARLR